MAAARRSVDTEDGAAQADPPMRVFKFCTPAENFAAAVKLLLGLRDPPEQRPDLATCTPDDEDCRLLLKAVDRALPGVKLCLEVQQLIQQCGLTDDDIKMLMVYKLEQPYPLYRWINGFLTASRRSPAVVKHVGPAFTMLYRALEKLPRVTCNAQRAAIVRNIPALRATFDNYRTRLSPGSDLSFWGFSSFTTDAEVMNSPAFYGGPEDDAIVYVCGQMTGMNLEPFKPQGMPQEHELLPLCPAVFKVVAVTKLGCKVSVTLEQQPHDDWAYVTPGANATTVHPAALTADAIAERILSVEHDWDPLGVPEATWQAVLDVLKPGADKVSSFPPSVLAGALGACLERARHMRCSPPATSFVRTTTELVSLYAEKHADAFATAAVRDALVAAATHATTADAIESLATAICNITIGRQENRDLFATAAVRDALVAAAAHATTTGAVYWLASAICNILSGSRQENKDLFATVAVRDALVAAAAHATTADAVRWLATAICNITNGGRQENRDVFATAAVRDALAAAMAHATTADAVEWLAGAIYNITIGSRQENRDVFATVTLRDALVAATAHATTADPVEWLATAIYNITIGSRQENKDLFATAAVRDALVAAAAHATTADAVEWLAGAICNITNGSRQQNNDLFATAALRDALVAAAAHATTADAVESLARAICKTTFGSQENKDLFATVAVRDALVAATAHATTVGAVYWLASAICNITSGSRQENKDLFATAAVRDALVAATAHATTADAVQSLAGAICNIVFGTQENTDLFATPAVRDALHRLERHATTPDSMSCLCLASESISGR